MKNFKKISLRIKIISLIVFGVFLFNNNIYGNSEKIENTESRTGMWTPEQVEQKNKNEENEVSKRQFIEEMRSGKELKFLNFQENFSKDMPLATFTWDTNVETRPKVMLGLRQGEYANAISKGKYTTHNEISLSTLQWDTAYYYKVVSRDRNGKEISHEGAFTTPKTPFQIVTPNVSVSSNQNKPLVTFSWNTDKITSGKVGFKLKGAPINYTEVNSQSNSTIHTVTLDGNLLNWDTSYDYQIVSINEKGAKVTYEGEFKTSPVPVPVNFNAVSRTDSIFLSWEYSLHPLAGGFSFEIERSRDGVNYERLADNIQKLFYSDSDNVQVGIDYYYRIRTVDKNGSESNWANLLDPVQLSDWEGPILSGIEVMLSTDEEAAFTFGSPHAKEYRTRLGYYAADLQYPNSSVLHFEEWSDWSNTTTVTYTNLTSGRYVVEAQARDEKLNESAVTSKGWRVNSVPTLDRIEIKHLTWREGDPPIQIIGGVLMEIYGSDADRDFLDLDINYEHSILPMTGNQPFVWIWNFTRGGSIGWDIDPSQAGTWYLAITLTDSVVATSQVLETSEFLIPITIIDDNDPPAIQPVPVQTVKFGETLDFTVKVTDREGDDIEINFETYDLLLKCEVVSNVVYTDGSREKIYSFSYCFDNLFLIKMRDATTSGDTVTSRYSLNVTPYETDLYRYPKSTTRIFIDFTVDYTGAELLAHQVNLLLPIKYEESSIFGSTPNSEVMGRLSYLCQMNLDDSQKMTVADILGFTGKRRDIWRDFNVFCIDGTANFTSDVLDIIHDVLKNIPRSLWAKFLCCVADYAQEDNPGVSGYTPMYGNNIAILGHTNVYGIFTHELGHIVDFFNATGDFHSLFGGDRTNYVSDYAMTNYLEDFAETFRIWCGCFYGWDSYSSTNQVLDDAIEKARDGKPQLLKKLLFMADLFSSEGDRTRFYTGKCSYRHVKIARRYINGKRRIVKIDDRDVSFTWADNLDESQPQE